MDLSFSELPEFRRDVERLSRKKLRSLEADLETFKKALSTGPESVPRVFPITYLKPGIQSAARKILKAKKFRSRDLNSTDKMRVIFAWLPTERQVVFIEIYSKDEKESEDKERILRNFPAT